MARNAFAAQNCPPVPEFWKGCASDVKRARYIQIGCEETSENPDVPLRESYALLLEAPLAVRSLRAGRGVELPGSHFMLRAIAAIVRQSTYSLERNASREPESGVRTHLRQGGSQREYRISGMRPRRRELRRTVCRGRPIRGVALLYDSVRRLSRRSAVP